MAKGSRLRPLPQSESPTRCGLKSKQFERSDQGFERIEHSHDQRVEAGGIIAGENHRVGRCLALMGDLYQSLSVGRT